MINNDYSLPNNVSIETNSIPLSTNIEVASEYLILKNNQNGKTLVKKNQCVLFYLRSKKKQHIHIDLRKHNKS